MERIVAKQLQDYLNLNQLHDPLQSAYRPQHSTETALLKVYNDIMLSIDQGENVILCLLDLSAAFDTIDHKILIDRLENRFGISGKALTWFISYLQHRCQSISINSCTSPPKALTTGVPQGSVLGPILFTMYMSPLGDLIREEGCLYSCYADDTQLYITINNNDSDRVAKLEKCLNSIRGWMATNKLKLNESKTELLFIHSRFKKSTVKPASIKIGDNNVSFSKSARNLGFTFDESMKMDVQIANISKSAYAVIRKISHLRKYLDKPATEKLVHAFLTSRLDYCNSLLSGIPSNLLNHVQRFQNTAARIITKSRKYDHISPILQSLHWLPVRQRISFKILLFTFKIINGQAPEYLSETITIRQTARSLRSGKAVMLETPRTTTQAYGDRSFSFMAATLWNKLSPELRSCKTYDTFKKGIKTFLYKQAFRETNGDLSFLGSI